MSIVGEKRRKAEPISEMELLLAKLEAMDSKADDRHNATTKSAESLKTDGTEIEQDVGTIMAASSYTHLRAHETPEPPVCRHLLEKHRPPNASVRT